MQIYLSNNLTNNLFNNFPLSNDLPNIYKDSKTLSIQRYRSIDEEIKFIEIKIIEIEFSCIPTHNLRLERKDKNYGSIFHKIAGCA